MLHLLLHILHEFPWNRGIRPCHVVLTHHHHHVHALCHTCRRFGWCLGRIKP